MGHIHEKIDFTASALIVSDNKVLLRMHDKYNVWLGVGGHIELDEDPVQALMREVKEECGLEIELVGRKALEFPEDEAQDLPVPAFISRHPTVPGHEHVDMIYVAVAKTTDIKPDHKEKEVEFKWFTREELKDPKYNINQHTRYYAGEAIRIASTKY